MSVEIEPFELSFRRPFTQEVSQILTIRNLGSSPVAFKVKTTAPKQYCVRPNSGRIEAGQDVEVTVLLQAMKQDPPPDTRCKDKFLVQSAVIPPDRDFASIPSIFESAADKSSIQEKKIRVNWLPAVGGVPDAAVSATTPNRQSLVNGHEATPDISRPYSSPSEDTNEIPSVAPPAYDSETKDESPLEEKAPSTTLSPVSATVPATAKMTYDELKAKLEEAEAQLAVALRDNGGLRQRNVKNGETEKTSPQLATAVRQGAEGVPVQIVAALCFLSFLLAYLFF